MYTLTMFDGWLKGECHEKFYETEKLGFHAMESLAWERMDLDRCRAAIDESGVELSAIAFRSKNEDYAKLIGFDHGIVFEDAYEAFLAAVRESLDAALKLRCKNIVVTVGKERTDAGRDVCHRNIVHALRGGAQLLKGTGVKIVVEPLNVLVNHKGYYLTATAEGTEIIDEVDSPCVRLLYDVYHQQITEGNIINNIRANISKIGHIHIGDVPGRNQPGTGEINYPNVFKAIADTGYDGYVVFECGITEPVEEVCRKMRAMVAGLPVR